MTAVMRGEKKCRAATKQIGAHVATDIYDDWVNSSFLFLERRGGGGLIKLIQLPHHV